MPKNYSIFAIDRLTACVSKSQHLRTASESSLMRHLIVCQVKLGTYLPEDIWSKGFLKLIFSTKLLPGQAVRRSRFQGVITPKQIYIFKNKLCRMENSFAKGVKFHSYFNICPRDISMTIFYVSWRWGKFWNPRGHPKLEFFLM